MIYVTASATAKLKTLILEHPEDPIVRLAIQDINDKQIKFTITLDSDPHPEDEVQEYNGLTVAIEQNSVSRMEGLTIDYQEPKGFSFHHPEQRSDDLLRLINPN